MKHRLYVPPPVVTEEPLVLPRERAHYLTRVLRLRRGDEVECFDGIGHAWQATLTDAGPRSATLTIDAQLTPEAEPQPRVHLVVGLLKGPGMDQVVQKATELGATDVWLIQAERSNVPGDPARLSRKLAHWQRIVESAAEQCGVAHLPRLHAPRRLSEFLAAPPAALVVLDPGGEPLPRDLPREPVAVLVGPEGGWSEPELRAAMGAGARRFGLGARILRAETAPLAVLAALRHGWGWQ